MLSSDSTGFEEQGARMEALMHTIRCPNGLPEAVVCGQALHSLDRPCAQVCHNHCRRLLSCVQLPPVFLQAVRKPFFSSTHPET